MVRNMASIPSSPRGRGHPAGCTADDHGPPRAFFRGKYLGKDVAPGIIEHARQMGVKLPPQLDDPSAALTPQLIVEVIRDVAFHYFPQLAPGGADDSH